MWWIDVEVPWDQCDDILIKSLLVNKTKLVGYKRLIHEVCYLRQMDTMSDVLDLHKFNEFELRFIAITGFIRVDNARLCKRESFVLDNSWVFQLIRVENEILLVWMRVSISSRLDIINTYNKRNGVHTSISLILLNREALFILESVYKIDIKWVHWLSSEHKSLIYGLATANIWYHPWLHTR